MVSKSIKKKRKVFFSKGTSNKEELSAAIGVTEGKLPITYLGIPLSANYLKTKDFSGLIDNVEAELKVGMLEISLFWKVKAY